MFSVIRSAFFPWLLVGLAVLFMLLGHKHGAEFAALRDHGVSAEAVITELEWKKQKNGSDEKEHVAHIEFSTDNGPVRDKVWITQDVAHQLRRHEIPWSIGIRYLPESPSTLVKASDSDDSDGEKFFARLLLLAGIVVFTLRHFFAK